MKSEILQTGTSGVDSRHWMLQRDTPFYPQINLLVDRVFKGASSVLDADLVGFYISGSVAMQGFIPERSDVDIVAITSRSLSAQKLEEIRRMHADVSNIELPYARRYECIYVPVEVLSDLALERHSCPGLHVGGSFGTDGFGTIERHIWRERAIIVSGPDPKLLTEPVSHGELKSAAYKLLQTRWVPQLTDDSRLRDDSYPVYAILTMCRALYTIYFGEVASKQAAASYAKQTYARKFSDLIDSALEYKAGTPFGHLKETISFIAFTLETLNVDKADS